MDKSSDLVRKNEQTPTLTGTRLLVTTPVITDTRSFRRRVMEKPKIMTWNTRWSNCRPPCKTGDPANPVNPHKFPVNLRLAQLTRLFPELYRLRSIRRREEACAADARLIQQRSEKLEERLASSAGLFCNCTCDEYL